MTRDLTPPDFERARQPLTESRLALLIRDDRPACPTRWQTGTLAARPSTATGLCATTVEQALRRQRSRAAETLEITRLRNSAGRGPGPSRTECGPTQTSAYAVGSKAQGEPRPRGIDQRA